MTKRYEVPAVLLSNIISYLESTSLPYKDVKAIIMDIKTNAVPIEEEEKEEAAVEGLN